MLEGRIDVEARLLTLLGTIGLGLDTLMVRGILRKSKTSLSGSLSGMFMLRSLDMVEE